MANNYNGDINDIIRRGLLSGSLNIFQFLTSIYAYALQPNPLGIIKDSSCVPGSDVVVHLLYSYGLSICAPYLAALLAIVLKGILSFASLPEIAVRVWVVLSEVILLFGYVCFYMTVVYTLELMLGSVYCATDSTSLILVIILGVLFFLGFIISIILR